MCAGAGAKGGGSEIEEIVAFDEIDEIQNRRKRLFASTGRSGLKKSQKSTQTKKYVCWRWRVVGSAIEEIVAFDKVWAQKIQNEMKPIL